MMRPDVNYYALLGITSTATPEEIIKAYRKKILQVHLDKAGPEQDSDICYKTIEAYRVLSNRKLRTKYDIQRDPCYKASEEFIPAGYICYDVGQSQLSKRFLKSITEWKEEFDSLNSNGEGISDNYFECFSSLMGQVLEVEDTAKALKDKENEFFCPVCDKQFVSETIHWEEILQPYITMFSCDNQNETGGLVPLLTYFEKLLGSSHFNWEPRSLPRNPLGFWASEEWFQLDDCDATISRILEFLPSEEDFEDSEEFIDFVEETFLSDSEKNSELYPELACKILIFILENQDDQNIVVERVQECLFKDELLEIMYLVSAMKNYLGCDHEEWTALAIEATGKEQPEIAMLWTKVAIEFSDSDDDEDSDFYNGVWYKLGMKLFKADYILAHFCFLFQGYGDDEITASEDWIDLGDDFCIKGDHHAAIEYYLHANLFTTKLSANNNDSDSDEEVDTLSKLLEKSKTQLKKGDRASASLYRAVYYTLKVKTLLSKLQKRKRDDAQSEFDPELEQLIELIPELDLRNPLEGFRIISATWPKAFESPVCQGIHKGTIAFLRRGRLTITAFNLILGSLHFLPDDDEEDEEEFEELNKELSDECNAMVVTQLQFSMKTSDFNSLADILVFISTSAESRCLLGTLQIIQEMNNEDQKEVIEKSPHLKAMKLLIEGTFAKIKKEWMCAMNLYQNALLCSPEVMHRVLPCISKLSQDLEFHEAILSQVQNEVKELKECFDCEEYPDVELFNKKSNRNSLVIADVVPQIDFGYKNSISKIQVDPDKVANQVPPPEEEECEPPPVETNTPMVTLDKTEEAIGSGNQSQLNAALSYIDLLKALPLPFQPGPIVMAASHFLRAMDETTDAGSLFAYRNAIMQMAENLLKIDKKTQASIQHGLTHKHMLSVLLSAHEKLSKAVRLSKTNMDLENEKEESNSGSGSNPDDSSSEESDSSSEMSDDVEKLETDSVETSDNDKKMKSMKKKSKRLNSDSSKPEPESIKTEEEEEEEEEIKVTIKRKCSSSSIGSVKTGSDLIKTSDAHLISRFLKNVINFPKIEPLANIPTLNPTDLIYVETLGNSFLSQFCNEKIGHKNQSKKIPKHLHAYALFVEVWKGRSQLTDFFTARLKAMDELVALKGWSLDDVEHVMKFPILNLTDDGWSSEYRTELQFPNPPKAFKNIYGFKIDNKTAKISFLLSRDLQTKYTHGNLFDTRDIQEIFSNGIEPKDCYLSLDSPDINLRSHPFKEAKFSTSNPECGSMHAPNFFMTLARAANLLCYLCSGLEICSKAPFNMKPTDEGLLSRLEEHLQHILRPAKARKDEDEIKSPELDIPNRFWLNICEVFEEEEEDDGDSNFTYKVGECKAQVKMNTFILTLNGSKSSITPEAEFARDFTKHYDEIGKFFPELLRLKELVKISLVCKKLKQILREKMTLLKQNGIVKEHQMKMSCVCKAIRELGIYLEEDEEKNNNVVGNSTDCNWFPASFCNNLETEIYEISAGVRINPEITYFPVGIPSDCVAVNAKELMAKKKLSFIRR